MLFLFLLKAFRGALRYLHITLLLTILPFAISIVVGTLIAIVRERKKKFWGGFGGGLVVILKGIPPTVMILAVNYLVLKPLDIWGAGNPVADWLRLGNKTYIGVIALTLYGIPIVSESIRGGLHSVDKGQYEAGASIGMTNTMVMRKIVLPQVFANAMPNICANLISILKATSVVYLINITDIMLGAIHALEQEMRYLEIYTTVALIYWALSICFEHFSYAMERRFAEKL